MLFWKRNYKQDSNVEQIEEKKEFKHFGLNDILYFIKREVGIDLFSKESVVEMKLKLFCQKREIYSFKELYEKIKIDYGLKQEVINLLTVSETYFFREEIQLNAIISYIKELNQRVSILCAPCATGEEVYSLAIKLMESRYDKNFEIIGIDINSEVIQRARKGEFTKRSLHKLNKDMIERYFIENESGYTIRKEKFPMVSFEVKNVFDLTKFSYNLFDIILSRNMFIYFDSETRIKVLKIFNEILKPHGRLYLGHADSPPQNQWFRESVENLCYEKDL